MQILNNNNPTDFNERISLRELFIIILNGKWIIVFLTSLITITCIIYSLLLPNIYESKAILAPTDLSSSISRSLQGYTGLAGLAGINLPSGVDEGNSAQALEKINSLSFFKNNILPKIFLPDLMAFESWNPKDNVINYDKSIYDKNSSKWVREYSFPRKQIPSSQESFKSFKKDHFRLAQDKNTGFISIFIKHQSPDIAKKWADLLINEINFYYRQKDKLASEKALEFLNEQINITNLSEVKAVISELLKEETKKLALIEANQYYVFDIIDPPVAMEIKSEPQRAIICVLGAIFGVLMSTILVFIKHYFLIKRA